MKTLTLAALGALMLAPSAFAENTVQDEISSLQHDWAIINYQTPDPSVQLEKMDALARQADQVSARWPDRAEPLVWSAIIKSTEAGIKGGMGALGLAKQARRELQQAIAIDGTALNGSAYTSLGSLYYQVPGRPIGFGSKKKALANLQKALAINPDGIDANYFYGDYLMHRKKYKEAITAFEHALAAPARPNRPVADAGRISDINTAMKEAMSKLER